MQNHRERFSPTELAMVLSHYELGVIESAKEFPRGSRTSPKLLLSTADGRYLLKRRAHGRDKPERVEFAHRLLQHLSDGGFPVPAIVETRGERETMLEVEGQIYELFEFVPGRRFDGSLPETYNAGKTLARFHHAVSDFDAGWQPPAHGYHDSPGVRQGLNAIPTTISSHDSVVGNEAALLGTTQRLYEHYDDAAAEVHNRGFEDWTPWINHGDWHPGNMLFHNGRVVVVLDFDSVRVQPRVADVANAMLQFSILRGGGEPDQWPEFFDLARMRRFLAGYLRRVRLEAEQRTAIVPLMIESLIAECAVPIAVTGSFGAMPGFGVLQMALRKVRWIIENRARMEQWMLE